MQYKLLKICPTAKFQCFNSIFLNDHLTRSPSYKVTEAQDTIEVLKVLFPKKALINGKSAEYKNRC